jgi:tetratricopeptide (TPR) repeat protein
MRRLTLAAFVVLCISSLPAFGAICATRTPDNACSRATDPQQACVDQLAKTPGSISTRMALCELLAAAGEIDNAQLTIQEGIDRCGGRGSDCRTLALALSNVKELRASRDRSDPLAAERRMRSERTYCVGIIANLGSISACESLLLSKPKDAALYKALGTKLLKVGDPTKATAYILRAREETANPDLLADLYDEAIRQRRPIVDDCLNGNSLNKCEQVLLMGAADEYLLLRRQGELLTRGDRYRQAKQALDRAKSLNPDDPGITRALAALARKQNPPKAQVPPTQIAQTSEPAILPAETTTEPNPEANERDQSEKSAPEISTPIVALRNAISANGSSY